MAAQEAPDARQLLQGLTRAVLDTGRKVDAVLELLLEQHGNGPTDQKLMTAGQVAQRLGKRPDWVYAHQEELGVLRLTDGPRPRLAFDWNEVQARMERRGTQPSASTNGGDPKLTKPRRRSHSAGAPLLEIKRPPKGARG
ncbi:MAG: hypothetical protein ACRDLL_16775 [Solirubrobacterales bacterium]